MPSIVLDAKLESITVANEFLHNNANHLNVNFPMIELVIEEVMVNIINHAYSKPEILPHQNMVGKLEFGVRTINFENRAFLSLWLKDWGQIFDPFTNVDNSNTLDMDIDERPIGGLGVHLIKTVSSHYFYSNDNNTNYIELFFEITA